MTPTEWEIFANDIYDKELSKNSYNVFKKSNLKMGRGPQYPFFQRRHSDGQQVCEKALSITNHQRNANQNHNKKTNEISLYTR